MKKHLAAAFGAASLAVLAALPAAAEIRIAAVGPMTGQYAAFGDQMKVGAAMAVQDINENGGLLGETVVLEVGDDVCDPKQAVAEANRLVGRETVFVAGHACSGSSIPASHVYQEEGVLMSADFWSITGEAGEGTLMTFNPDPRRNPAAKVVVERFQKGGIEPEGYILSTYATIQAWATAVKMAGTVEPQEVADALRLGSFETVLGEIKFDRKGDVTAPGFVVYRWSKGGYDYAEN